MTHTDLLNKKEVDDELKKFKQFALQKSMVDVSIGMILANSLGKVVSAVSSNIIMPILGWATNAESWRKAVWHPTKTMNIEIGDFVGSIIDFLLTALILYILYIKIVQPLLYPPEDEIKPLPKIEIFPPHD